MNNDKINNGKINKDNKTEVCQFGGHTSAFTRYKKPELVKEHINTDLTTNTHSNRKSAFARIKRLCCIQDGVCP